MRVNDGYFEGESTKGITEVDDGKLSAVSALPAYLGLKECTTCAAKRMFQIKRV